MRNFFIILLALICLNACKDKKAEGSSIKNDGIPDNNSAYVITDIPGSQYKLGRYKDEKKKITDEGHLLNGKKIGAWFTFYEDGRVLTVRNYIDDKIEGYFISVDPLGRVVQQVPYRNNYVEGVATLYDGRRKVRETTYKQGKKEGPEREFTDVNLLQKESTFKADSLDGPMRFFNEEGKVTAQFDYKNGQKVGGGIK